MSVFIEIQTNQYPLTASEIMGANRHMSFPVPFEAPDGYAPVAETAQPAHNANTHRVVEAAPAEQGGVWAQRWTVVALTAAEKAAALAAAKAQLLEAATAKRWAVETGGVTFPDGTRVGSTTEDQNRITTVIANAQLAGVTSVDFKAASGWLTLSLAELQGIAAAIALHVQDCFSAERDHHEAIASLTLAQARAYDINGGWPA
ncbi:MAG: DUF4376 domain-containing protein [Comamonadaceae bacterium]|nr:MAG: DUF4376 domain-containing protein [Comamonadaceae bacterium]